MSVLPPELIAYIGAFIYNPKDYINFHVTLLDGYKRGNYYAQCWKQLSVPYPLVAIEGKDPIIEWRLGDKIHRESTAGPAVIRANGTQVWYQHGLIHRGSTVVDGVLQPPGPAVICPIGQQEWYQYGLLHRDEGPAIISPYGTQMWYFYGEPYVHNGLAIVSVNGELCIKKIKK